jgi:hypothetical protein
MLVFCCMWMAVDGRAIADIYKCTDAQGGVIYTDDPSKMPRDCNTDQSVNLPRLNVIPAETVSPGKPRAAGSPVRKTQQGDEASSYATFNNQAQDLVDRYNSARQKATFSPLFRNKEAAKSELRGIQSEKHDLMIEVEQSSLSRSQKDQIIGKLSRVPD